MKVLIDLFQNGYFKLKHLYFPDLRRFDDKCYFIALTPFLKLQLTPSLNVN
jgi:hypothetical protein